MLHPEDMHIHLRKQHPQTPLLYNTFLQDTVFQLRLLLCRRTLQGIGLGLQCLLGRGSLEDS